MSRKVQNVPFYDGNDLLVKLEYVIELKGSKCPYDTTRLAARF